MKTAWIPVVATLIVALVMVAPLLNFRYFALLVLL
jgi:hypothetical protein